MDRRVYPVRRVGETVWDAQGALPWGWCPGCGMEIWRREADLCEKCEKREAIRRKPANNGEKWEETEEILWKNGSSLLFTGPSMTR